MPAGSCAWDINCGLCEEWAEAARLVVGGDCVWLDQVDDAYQDVAHCVLLLDGRYFDSQHPSGVDHPSELSIVRGVSRTDWLVL